MQHMATTTPSPRAPAPKRPRVPKRDPNHYHHGDLRTALLAAAEQVLIDRGVDGFTLRECARRAGVSHAAPAHHFGDARGLLSALASQGFERMAAMMQAARDAAGGDVRAALLGTGGAYIQFAVAYPGLFALMFRSQLVDVRGRNPQAGGKSSFEHLCETLAAARGEPVSDAPAFQTRAMLAWSTAHGLSSLLLDGGLAPAGNKTAAAALAKQLAPALLDALWPALIGKDA
jgi:AcrR family transcriptional regulator